MKRNTMSSPVICRQQLLNQEISIMKAQLLAAQDTDAPLQGGLIYTGNVHDAVPRALLLSKALGPREKITWQMIRLYAPGNRAAVFPSYTDLQYQLAAADKDRASRDTVSQAIKILRLERWLSLVDTVRLRDINSGRITACRNIYALHDEPVPFDDAEQLDPGYMTLLEKCAADKSCKILRQIARRQIHRMKKDAGMRHQHSRLAQIESRLSAPQSPSEMVPPYPTVPGINRSPETGLGAKPSPTPGSPGSGLPDNPEGAHRSPVSGNDAKSLKNTVVRDPAYVRRSFSENIKTTYVYPGQCENTPLPKPLAERLSPDDHLQVLRMSDMAGPDAATQILSEACRLIAARELHNPCGWVLKMLQQARQGNWNPPSRTPVGKPPVAPPASAEPEKPDIQRDPSESSQPPRSRVEWLQDQMKAGFVHKKSGGSTCEKRL